jgi:hypothetical protein
MAVASRLLGSPPVSRRIHQHEHADYLPDGNEVRVRHADQIEKEIWQEDVHTAPYQIVNSSGIEPGAVARQRVIVTGFSHSRSPLLQHRLFEKLTNDLTFVNPE